MSDYKPRIADALLKRKLAGNGAVLIQGPQWCGKTTTVEQIAASFIYLDAPDKLKEIRIKADINPQELLASATPRLLDEWQTVPHIQSNRLVITDCQPCCYAKSQSMADLI